MEFKKIVYTKSNNIAKIILNNPKKLNSIDLATFHEIWAALDDSEKCEEVRVIVFCGEGSSFCAGADVQSMIDNGWEQMPYMIRDMARAAGEVALKIRNVKKPVIASLKGAVAGCGFNIALLCDFRIAADNCKFLQAFINLGLIADTGGIYLLSRHVGVGKATELAFTGRVIKTDEADALGLLNKVVTIENLESETMRLAQRLAQGPGQALRMMKSLINRNEYSDFESYLDNEVEYQFICANTDDFKEGLKAFVEKRKPQYVSR